MLDAATGNGNLRLAGSADEWPPFDHFPPACWYWGNLGEDHERIRCDLPMRSMVPIWLLPISTCQAAATSAPAPPSRRRSRRRGRPPAAARCSIRTTLAALHFRILNVSASGVPATIVAFAPRDAVLELGMGSNAHIGVVACRARYRIDARAILLVQIELGLRPLEASCAAQWPT